MSRETIQVKESETTRRLLLRVHLEFIQKLFSSLQIVRYLKVRFSLSINMLKSDCRDDL